MTAEDRPSVHPEAWELAAYLDRALEGAPRDRLEDHLAGCAQCRAELGTLAELVRTAPGARFSVPWGLASVAVLALLLVPAIDLPRRLGPEHREPAVTTTAAPVGIEPRGPVDSVPALVWSAVPHAVRYRLLVIDDEGRALWRLETADTTAALPDTVRLRPGSTYFWKVEAETGFERWVASELMDFIVEPRR